jgi:hypothetical protein
MTKALQCAGVLTLLAFSLRVPVSQAFPEAQGTYLAEGGLAAQQQVVESAINTAAAQFNFLIRGIARSRLRAVNPVFPDIKLHYSKQSFSLSSGADELTMEGDTLEKFPFVTPKGLQVTVDQFVGEKEVKRVFHSEDGRREVIYQLAEDKSLLLVKITVHSSHLHQPMSYELRYRMNP